jgi:hypothetical protein
MTPGVLKVHMPFKIRKRGGRKLIVSPNGHEWHAAPSHVSKPLAKALGRAFRWRKLLENGEYSTIDEIAKAESVNASYVSRVLRLTLISPQILEGILEGRECPQLQDLLNPFPASWHEQVLHQTANEDDRTQFTIASDARV